MSPDLVAIGSSMTLRQMMRICRALTDDQLRGLAEFIIDELDDREADKADREETAEEDETPAA